MHEFSVTQSILDIALRHAEEAGATQITHISLVIGQLSSFVDDSIQFYWDMASAGTIAVGATLHFRRVPAQLRCKDCGQVYTLDGNDTTCAACGSVRIEVISGDEFYIESIDIETNDISAKP